MKPTLHFLDIVDGEWPKATEDIAQKTEASSSRPSLTDRAYLPPYVQRKINPVTPRQTMATFPEGANVSEWAHLPPKIRRKTIPRQKMVIALSAKLWQEKGKFAAKQRNKFSTKSMWLKATSSSTAQHRVVQNIYRHPRNKR
ncbi:hypothetical protein AcV5_003522 [Taiwanofungus camphoratus]|nr:hypothetical protein AcV5_003522 [Antrodia cinnamomea]KAI0958172.1 hypothetical protein AcV7_004058 [Antrodia cinnamomea]